MMSSSELNFQFSIARRVHGDIVNNHISGGTFHASVVYNASSPEKPYSKTFFERHIDGRYLVDINDPFINGLLDGADLVDVDGVQKLQLSKHYGREQLTILKFEMPQYLGCKFINVSGWSNFEHKRHFYGSFVLLDVDPSNYNLAKWIYEVSQKGRGTSTLDVFEVTLTCPNGIVIRYPETTRE